jgi:Bifunctional DNA primase/polymerase, N-terminal
MSSAAYETAWSLVAHHGLKTIPVDVARVEGRKQIRPLVRFRDLWGAPPTAELVEATWSGNEDASGIAVLLDRRAGLFAVDTDSAAATTWAIEEFRRHRTPWFQSARGRKWLFRLPGFEVRSSASKLRPAVDVRAPNSALVIPPTPGYRWVPTYSLDAIPVARCPERLRKALETLAPGRVERTTRTRPVAARSLYAAAALEDEVSRVARAANGTRNDTLNDGCFRVWRFVLSGELAAEEVAASFSRATASWEAPEREAAKRTIRSAAEGRERVG